MKKWLIGALLAATVAVPANAQDNGNWRSRQQGWQESRGDQPRPERVRPAPQAQTQAAPTFQTRGGGRGDDGNRGGWRGRGEAQAGGVPAQTPQGSWRTRQQGGGNPQADGSSQRRDWQRRDGGGRSDLAQPQRFDGQTRLDGQRFDGQGRFDRNRRDGNRDLNRDADRNGRVDRFNSADTRRGGNSWRTDDRGGVRGYNDGRRYDNRRGYNDGRQFGRDDGRWSRNWRTDNRYDWNRYRSNNRYAYRLPRYYSPYGWNYGYRRFSIGVTLSSVLWGQNYWIDDPWSYRLPEAYGPYRWVRYYNDALLIDLETGQVIDTVYDIFWG